MDSYATKTTTRSPLMDVTFAWRSTAFVLLLVAVLGFVLNLLGDGNQLSFGNTFLTFTWTHDVLHLVLAGAAFLFGFSNLPHSAVRWAAVLFGVVYAGLGVVGFFALQAPSDALLALTPTLNIIHLLLGGFYLLTGIASKTA